MGEVADNLRRVQDRVAAAAARAGRASDEVTLVAVSKRQPLEAVREAWDAGQRDFGENHAQALRDRAAALADLGGLRWHAIGPLQTNKARVVAQLASAFHALDRLVVAEELSRRVEGTLDCYVEVNVAGEASKHGVGPGEVADLVAAAQALPGLRVVGLMCMPPLEEAEAARPWFRKTAALARGLGLPGLSMGTTGDFEVAIEEGATAVRVGRSIFGARA